MNETPEKTAGTSVGVVLEETAVFYAKQIGCISLMWHEKLKCSRAKDWSENNLLRHLQTGMPERSFFKPNINGYVKKARTRW